MTLGPVWGWLLVQQKAEALATHGSAWLACPSPLPTCYISTSLDEVKTAESLPSVRAFLKFLIQAPDGQDMHLDIEEQIIMAKHLKPHTGPYPWGSPGQRGYLRRAQITRHIWPPALRDPRDRNNRCQSAAPEGSGLRRAGSTRPGPAAGVAPGVQGRPAAPPPHPWTCC